VGEVMTKRAALLPLPCGERVGVRGGCSREHFYSSSRRRPEALLNSRMAGHPVASVFDCRDTATWLACRGLPSSCRRPGYFSLLAHARAGARANGEAGPKGAGQDARSKEK